MKKKFLAFLLTLMTVAVLVPAIVASAVAVPLNIAVPATDETIDERAEVAVHDPLLEEDNVEVLNKDGVRVGYYETLAEAVADLRDGDTVRLLDNVTISATLELSGNFVLDGNGFTLTRAVEEPEPTDPEGGEGTEPTDPEGGEGTEPTDPEGGEGTEPTDPEGGEGTEPTDPEGGEGTEPTDPEGGEGTEPTDPEGGEGTEPTDPEGGEGTEPTDPEGSEVSLLSDEDLTEAFDAAISVVDGGSNIEIRNLIISVPDISVGIKYKPDYEAASALTLSNCSVMACDMAIWVNGENAYLTIKGTGSSYYGYQTIAATRGYVDIYGGTFAADSEVIGARNATVAVYGGTFLLGDSPYDVIGSHENATVILAGGEYATTAESGATVFYTEGGEIKVLDGKYYLADADSRMIDGDGVQIYSGFFYGQNEVDLTAATVDAAYTAKTYNYEDPTFPANTKLDYVKELGYLAMTQVTYDAAWLAENGCNGTAYDVTNGVYNEYPVSYYAFELERAYWYLGNGGSLTVTQSVEITLDTALTFRARPQTSVVTLTSAGVGDAALTLCVNMDGNYPLVATGGTYNVADLKLVNNLGSAILLDEDSTDAYGSTLNLYGGASVAGYNNHAIWVGAYATVNMYDGSYVHAAAGQSGNYDGTGFAVLAMVGGNLNMYGGNLGYARVAGENGRMVDMLATGQMSTIAVGVGDAATCVSSINIYNGKLGKSATDLSNATAIFNLTEASERIDGTKLYIENGEFNASLNNIIRCSNRDLYIHIKGGAFNGASVRSTVNAGYSDLIVVDGLDAEICNHLVIEGGSFSGGRDQITICNYADVSISNSYHTGAMSSVFACHGNASAKAVSLTDVTVESAVHAFWCNGSAINVTGGSFTVKGASWGPSVFQVESDAVVAGDITITGGKFATSNGYFVNVVGLAQRTVTVNGAEFNSIGGSCFCMNTEGRADVVINGGTYTNMCSASHQIETWGDPAKAVGSLTINGDAQFVRGGTASGRMIKFYGANNVTINGGYFDSETSEAIVIEKEANRSFAPTLTLTITGGTFRNEKAGYSLIYMNANANSNIIITGGVFENYISSGNWGPCLDIGGKGVTNIYGGSFVSMASAGVGSDACVTVGDGICNIYAGTFRGNGMCVARGLAGVTGGETDLNGSITTAANSRLNIYGGVFTLENNAVRTAGNYGHDAVVRCGGGSTYAFVSIYGGTFIDNSQCSNRVISKNNVHSSINLTGGVFLASEAQEYYYQSSGMAPTGGSEYPTTPYEKKADDPIVNYGGKEYHQLVVGTGASSFNGKMEDGAQIRLVKDADGNVDGGIRFVSRYTPNVVTSLKSLAGGSMDNVTFGTLIVKSELLEGLNSFSHSALKQAGVEDYMDIVADKGVSGSESVGLTVNAALTNISAADYETVYAAIGYAMVTLDNGEAAYFYTDFDAENNSRSIAQVAAAAFADVNDTQTKGYVYPHITMDGMFSRYTAEEQAVLQTYIPVAEETPEVSE